MEKFNPTTGGWTHTQTDERKDTHQQTSSSPSTSEGSGLSDNNLVSSGNSKDSSVGATEKKYNTIEINTLNGSLQYIANKDTIKLKAGDTVKLEGIGTYLSGDYYVQDITRTLDSSGYTHTATLVKTNFGKSLKKKTEGTVKPEKLKK